MNATLAYILARGKEPSSYASLGTALAITGVSVDPGAMRLALLGGTVLCAALGIFLQERGTKPALQIAEDVAEGIVAATRNLPGGNASAPVPMTSRATIALALIFLLPSMLVLAACGSQTADQKAAGLRAVASGLVCLADETGHVVAIASTSDSNAVKGLNAMIGVGGALMTDQNCAAAIADGVAAVPAGPVSPAVPVPVQALPAGIKAGA